MLVIESLGLVLAAILVVVLTVRSRLLFPCVAAVFVMVEFMTPLPRFSVGPVDLYVSDFLYLLALLNLVVRFGFDRKEIPREAWIATGLCVLYMSYLAISEFYYWYYLDHIALDKMFRAVVRATYPIVVISILFSLRPSDMKLYSKVLLITLGCVLMKFFYVEIFVADGFRTSSGTIRNLPGEVMVILHFAIVYPLFYSNLPKYLRLGLIAACVLAIGLIGHRSGFLSLLMIIGLFGLYVFYSGKAAGLIGRNILILCLSGILVTLFVFFFKGEAVDRIFTRAADLTDTSLSSTTDRLNKWNLALQTTMENPIGGTKFNLLPDYYGHRISEAAFGNFDPAKAHKRMVYLQTDRTWPPHNMFINIVSKNGVIGLMLFLAIVVYSLRLVMAQSDLRYKFFCLSWIGGNFVHLTFNNAHYPEVLIPLYLSLVVFPILFGYAHANAHKEDKKKTSVADNSREVSIVRPGDA